ncbi:MAG TPA: ribonuclease HIII [Firmicutes bacterium]|nr:ribonuclease HIII [Bacillota bacterium]
MNKKEIVSIKINEKLKDKIENQYKSFKEENNNEYIVFFAKKNGTSITIYVNKKNEYKVTFIGTNALKEARLWDENAEIATSKNKLKNAHWLNLDDQIGSDEVGTGDFFGPICVAASLVRKSDIAYLKSLGVDDSKKLTDEKIKELGKILINKFPYSQLSLENEKYNKLHDEGINLNEMKTKMHNQVLLNLKNKYHIDNIFVDQFLEKDKYYAYLSDTKDIVSNINFKTKGESYFPSVAVASIIARYSFLQKMEKLSDKYKMDIPFGASTKVNNFAKKFIKTYGIDELNKIVKKNFANYKEIIK